MEVDLAVAPHCFRAASMPLHDTLGNRSGGVFQIDIATPQDYRFARVCALPELKEYKPVIVRPLGPDGLENCFPFFGLIRTKPQPARCNASFAPVEMRPLQYRRGAAE